METVLDSFVCQSKKIKKINKSNKINVWLINNKYIGKKQQTNICFSQFGGVGSQDQSIRFDN
jgi:hypothetical protein